MEENAKYHENNTKERKLDYNEKRNRVIRIIIDVVIFSAAFLIVILTSVDKIMIIEPYKRGFSCDDHELKYPHLEETVNGPLIIVLAIFVLPVIMLFVETFYILTLDKEERKLSTYVSTLYKTIGWYLLGGTFTLLVVEICKACVGRLRPHFFEVCKPNWDYINCSEHYVTDYNCTNEDEEVVISLRKSFPSGHSAAACYEALYLVIYLQIRIQQKTEWGRAICPLIQTLSVGGAIFISISRLQDHHHHATDVIGGAVTGISGCIITIVFHSDLTKEYVPPSKIDAYRELRSIKTEHPPMQDKNAKGKDKKNKKKVVTSGNGVEVQEKGGIDNKAYQRESVINTEDNAKEKQQRPETPEIIITDTDSSDNIRKRKLDNEITIEEDAENTKM